METKDVISFIANGAAVKRFHTVTTLQTETVGHHSHGVAMMCLVFDPDASRSLIMAALFHDLGEQILGDIPSPTKRKIDPEGRLDTYEATIMQEHGVVMPELTAYEQRVLKLADIASGMLFCGREMSLGNQGAELWYQRYLSYANEMELTNREEQVFESIGRMFYDFG